MSAQRDFRIVPARYRRALYARHGTYWYWTLIRNARHGPAGELHALAAWLRRSETPPRLIRTLLALRIRWHLRTAADPPPRSELERVIRESDRIIHDTTAYEFSDETTLYFFPRWRSRRRGSPGEE